MKLIAPPPPRSSGRWIVSPKSGMRVGASRRRALEQRKQVFQALCGAALGTFLLALIAGGGMWQLHFLVDGVLATYAVGLLGVKRRRADAASRIRPLPGRRETAAERFFDEPLEMSGRG